MYLKLACFWYLKLAKFFVLDHKWIFRSYIFIRTTYFSVFETCTYFVFESSAARFSYLKIEHFSYLNLNILRIWTQHKINFVPVFRTCNKDIKLNVVSKSSVKMPNAIRFKDQIPKCLNSMLLYKFPCNTCNSVCIGKTKRQYLVRQFEHLGLSVFTNKTLKYSYKDATAICKHCHHQNHVSCTDNFKKWWTLWTIIFCNWNDHYWF